LKSFLNGLEPTLEIRPLLSLAIRNPKGVASKRWITVDDDEASNARVWDITCDLLRYLETAPAAKDTLEGVAQWWLWLEVTEPVLKDVRQAVALLVSKGILLETRYEGAPSYYGLNPLRRKMISRIFSGLESNSMRG
jgi:hypothetical protein